MSEAIGAGSPSTGPQLTFTRDDIVAGLREVVAILRASGRAARIQILGGAAIALAYHAERVATVDVDGPVSPRDAVLDAAHRVAREHNWRPDWMNDAAAQFLPSGYGRRSAEWVTVFRDQDVTVQVADAATLLAMKVHAAQRRGNREADDLAVLVSATGTSTVDEIEDLYDAFYPGDQLTARTHELLTAVLDAQVELPSAPILPDLDMPSA